jgi:hypothetical protein
MFGQRVHCRSSAIWSGSVVMALSVARWRLRRQLVPRPPGSGVMPPAGSGRLAADFRPLTGMFGTHDEQRQQPSDQKSDAADPGPTANRAGSSWWCVRSRWCFGDRLADDQVEHLQCGLFVGKCPRRRPATSSCRTSSTTLSGSPGVHTWCNRLRDFADGHSLSRRNPRSRGRIQVLRRHRNPASDGAAGPRTPQPRPGLARRRGGRAA